MELLGGVTPGSCLTQTEPLGTSGATVNDKLPHPMPFLAQQRQSTKSPTALDPVRRTRNKKRRARSLLSDECKQQIDGHCERMHSGQACFDRGDGKDDELCGESDCLNRDEDVKVPACMMGDNGICVIAIFLLWLCGLSVRRAATVPCRAKVPYHHCAPVQGGDDCSSCHRATHVVTWTQPKLRVVTDRLRSKVRGDGNCFWRAIAKSGIRTGQRNTGWKQLKHRVCEQIISEQKATRDTLDASLSRAAQKGAWVNNAMVERAVEILQLDMVVAQRVSHGWATTHRIRPVVAYRLLRPVVVALDQCHYDLIRVRCQRDVDDEPCCNLFTSEHRNNLRVDDLDQCSTFEYENAQIVRDFCYSPACADCVSDEKDEQPDFLMSRSRSVSEPAVLPETLCRASSSWDCSLKAHPSSVKSALQQGKSLRATEEMMPAEEVGEGQKSLRPQKRPEETNAKETCRVVRPLVSQSGAQDTVNHGQMYMIDDVEDTGDDAKYTPPCDFLDLNEYQTDDDEDQCDDKEYRLARCCLDLNEYQTDDVEDNDYADATLSMLGGWVLTMKRPRCADICIKDQNYVQVATLVHAIAKATKIARASIAIVCLDTMEAFSSGQWLYISCDCELGWARSYDGVVMQLTLPVSPNGVVVGWNLSPPLIDDPIESADDVAPLDCEPQEIACNNAAGWDADASMPPTESATSISLSPTLTYFSGQEWDDLEQLVHSVPLQKSAFGQAMFFGCIAARGRVFSAATARYPHLARALNEWMHRLVPKAYYTVIGVLHSCCAPWHRDMNNVNMNYFVSFGNDNDRFFIGLTDGSLRIEHTYRRLIQFDPVCVHATYSSVPRRALVAFTRVTPRDPEIVQSLSALGFPLMLDGGAKDEDIGRAVQRVKSLQTGFNPKQVRNILLLDPKLVDRVLAAPGSVKGRKQMWDMVRSAAIKLTIQASSVASPPTEAEEDKAAIRKSNKDAKKEAEKASQPGAQSFYAKKKDDNEGKGTTGRGAKGAGGSKSGRQNKGDGKGQSAQLSQDKQKDPVKPRGPPKLALIAEDWPVPVAASVGSIAGDSVVMVENEFQAMAVAAHTAEGRRLAFVAPCPLLETKCTQVERLPVRFKDEAGHIAILSVHLHQLGNECVKPKDPGPIPQVQHQQSHIVKVTFDKAELPSEILPGDGSLLKTTDAREYVSKLLPPTANTSIIDMWGVKTAETGWSALCRCRARDLAVFLALSGLEKGLWIDTPRDETSKFDMVWLRGESAIEHADAKTMTQSVDHFGMIRKFSKDAAMPSFAVRVAAGDAPRIKSELRMDSRSRYVIHNIPNEMAESDLQEVLQRAQWQVEFVPDSRRCRKYTSSILVRAEKALTIGQDVVSVYPVRFNSEIVNLRIEPKTTRRTESPQPSATQPVREAPSTWGEAVAGRAKGKGKGSAKVGPESATTVGSNDGHDNPDTKRRKLEANAGTDTTNESLGLHSSSSAIQPQPAVFAPSTTAAREAKLSVVEKDVRCIEQRVQ
eukprot:2363463-Amphidinium_carterae.1